MKLGELKAEDKEKMHNDEKAEELSTLLGEDELKKMVEKEMGKFLSEKCIHIELTDRIFQHEDE